MGFFLDGYLGRRSQLAQWSARFPAAVACPLDGELALVPLTGRLTGELGMRPTDWALEASHAGAVVHFSIGEFGDQSHGETTLCRDGILLSPQPRLRAALEYLRLTAEIAFDLGKVDLEQYRGENAAEKWVAATRSPGTRGTR